MSLSLGPAAGDAAIDLRSDTVTRPTPQMLRAMADAELGDDVYGEDPTVARLEEVAAGITGKEAALFVPSGCMANLIAHLVYPVRGEQVIAGRGSHCLVHEAGAPAMFAGCWHEVVGDDGLLDAASVERAIRPASFDAPATRLVWLENTHNMSGGRVYPIEELARIHAVCEAHELPVHLDGARIFNAAVASGRTVEEIARYADTLSFCLSKGLGCPVGSVLCGPRAFISDARRWRKRLGGGMRQAGVLAAAGLWALEHHVARLADDHARARRLAERLAAETSLDVDPARVETNIVVAATPAGIDAEQVVARAERAGVRFCALDAAHVRLVTHLDVGDAAIDEAVRRLVAIDAHLGRAE